MKDKWDNLPKPLSTHLGNICVEQTVVAVVIPVVKPTVRASWPSLDHVIYSVPSVQRVVFIFEITALAMQM